MQITCLGCSSTGRDLVGSGSQGQGQGQVLPDERRDLLCSLPLAELAEPALAGPGGGVDDLEEELAGPGVEDEDHAVDGLGGEVALEGLVDGHTVDVRVVQEPDDVVVEELAVVGAREVGLGHVTAVQLQPSSHPEGEERVRVRRG